MVFSKDGPPFHLRDFWYRLKFGHLPLDKDGQEDLYALVVSVIPQQIVCSDLRFMYGSAWLSFAARLFQRGSDARLLLS